MHFSAHAFHICVCVYRIFAQYDIFVFIHGIQIALKRIVNFNWHGTILKLFCYILRKTEKTNMQTEQESTSGRSGSRKQFTLDYPLFARCHIKYHFLFLLCAEQNKTKQNKTERTFYSDCTILLFYPIETAHEIHS